MALRQISQPAAEPVSLTDAKLHLRVDFPDDDALISALIVAARQQAEMITRRVFVTQQWAFALDAFPNPGSVFSSANWYGPQWSNSPGPLTMAPQTGKTGYEIRVPLAPLVSVDSLQYLDTDGVLQTLAPSAYKVDTFGEPSKIVPAYATGWPATRTEINAVQVTFTAGYGAASAVPEGIKRWMLLMVGALYENREMVAAMTRGHIEALPFDCLLSPYRLVTF